MAVLPELIRTIPAHRLQVRVCFIVPQLMLGGGEVHLLTLCRGLDRDKFDLTVLSLNTLSDEERRAQEASEATIAPRLRQVCKVLEVEPLLRAEDRRDRALAHLAEIDPDLVLFHGFAEPIAIVRALQPRPYTIQICHTEFDAFSGDIYRQGADVIDRVVAVQEGIRRRLITAYGVPPEKVVTICNAVDAGLGGSQRGRDCLAATLPVSIGVAQRAGIGDTIMLTATLAGLRRKYPAAHITAYVSDFATDVLRGNPNVDAVRGFAETMGEADIERAHRSEHDIWVRALYVPLEFHNNGKLPQARAEAEFRAARYADLASDFPYSARPITKWGKHVTEIMAEALGLRCGWRDVTVTCDAGLRGVSRPDGPYAIVHDWTAWAKLGGRVRRWFPEPWEVVTRRLSDMGLRVIQLGGADEEPIPGACTDYRGRTSFPEMVSLVRNAELCITVDAVTCHLAAAVGTPAVVLFGPTPAALIGYPCHANLQAEWVCEPCWWSEGEWRVRCVRNRDYACMRAITPDWVMAEAQRLLGRGAVPLASAWSSPVRRRRPTWRNPSSTPRNSAS